MELHLAPDRSPGTIYEPFPMRQSLVIPCESAGIKGTCNGLFCFASLSRGLAKIVLCNPSIRLQVDIPPIRLDDTEQKWWYSSLLADTELNRFYSSLSCGVGFDCLRKEYKVVTFADHRADGRDPVSSIVALYSTKTESWKTLDSLAPSSPYTPEGLSVFLGGFIHWLVLARRDNFIMVFDICEEVFGRMELPEIDRVRNDHLISVANGSLYLQVTNVGASCTSFEVWVMKEYGRSESWMKQHMVVHQLVRYIEPTAGGKYLGCNDNRELVLYDLETNEIKTLGRSIPRCAFWLVETLELLDFRNSKLITS